MRTKIKPADTWFSKCVREASDWTCGCCGKKHEKGSTGLHNSHHYSRRHRTVRWCSQNTMALCFSCHQWFGGNPLESGRWLEALLGETHIGILDEKKNCGVKVSKIEEKEIATHYKAELQKLEERRLNGEVGQLDFVSWQ